MTRLSRLPWSVTYLTLFWLVAELEQVPRTLRVFLSHSVQGQPWQNDGERSGTSLDPDSLDFSSGQGIPSWTFRVEGRLLDSVSPCNKFVSCPTFTRRVIADCHLTCSYAKIHVIFERDCHRVRPRPRYLFRWKYCRGLSYHSIPAVFSLYLSVARYGCAP